MFDFIIFCHEIHGDISGKGPRPGIGKVLFPATPLVRAHTALGFLKKNVFFFFFSFLFSCADLFGKYSQLPAKLKFREINYYHTIK